MRRAATVPCAAGVAAIFSTLRATAVAGMAGASSATASGCTPGALPARPRSVNARRG